MKSNIGIQIILSIVLTMCSININAQTVGYTYRPLAAEGCNMKYSVAKQDTAYYIIATVKSDRLNFLKESTMLLKTFDGEVIKLYGSQIGSGSETAGIVSGTSSTKNDFPTVPPVRAKRMSFTFNRYVPISFSSI